MYVGWTATATKEEFLAKFADFDPKFLRILDLPVHSPIRKWKLRVLPELPTWILGRAALLGDAAHATLPLLGQGVGMAIEEAGSLGCLLPAGTRREDIPARLQAYQDLRKERGDFVRKESVEQATSFTFSGAERGTRNSIKGKFAELTFYSTGRQLQAVLLQYDAIQAAQKCYHERFGKD